jgi:Tfp pilus assembly protein PilO
MATKDKTKNKKLISATTIIVAALIIIIAANAFVWKNRLDKGSEILSLTGEMTQVSREIKNVPQPAADLSERLIEARADLEAAQAAFPAQFNRNDIIDYITSLSRDCQVEVLPISSQGWSVDKANLSYPVLKLSATVTGNFTQVNNFISSLQHGRYFTLLIPNISLSRQSPFDGSANFSSDNTSVTGKLSISIYARPAAVVKGN